MKLERKTIRRHCNIPQLLFQKCMSTVNVCLWGRSTGKSEGPDADFTKENIFTMPRANGFILGTSYSQILSRTIPAIFGAWEERFRLIEDKHFWKGKYAPDRFKIPKAFRHPVDPKHYIQFYNGSGIYLASQDRPGLINGVRTSYGLVPEARLINKKLFDDDVIPTMTGCARLYGHLPNYASLLFSSDMPRTTKGRWLLEFKNKMNSEVIEAICNVDDALVKMRREYIDSSDELKSKMRPRLLELYGKLAKLKKDSTYYSTATMWDNIDVLGLEPFKHLRRILEETDWLISVMNKEIYKLAKGFYAKLDENTHGYTMPNEEYMDNLVYDYHEPPEMDCRWELDVDPDRPLYIAFDHNNAINCVVTKQMYDGEFRTLSLIYVEHPQLLRDLVKKWHNFYKHQEGRKIEYYYDSTSTPGTAETDINFSDIIIAQLREYGWSVEPHYIGQIGSHHSRFFFYGLWYSGKSRKLPKHRYNKTMAAHLATSQEQAGVKKIGDIVKKDKDSEKPNSGILPIDATHASEANDILDWGVIRPLLGDESEFIDMLHF